MDAGEKVVVLDDLSTGFRWSVPPEAVFVDGRRGRSGPRRPRSSTSTGSTAILHFAAKIVVPESVADPLAYYLNNTVKCRALIETAVRSGVKNFIFSSTATVYGNADVSPLHGGSAACADQPLRPHQADDRVDAGGRRARPRPALRDRCATSTSPAPIRRDARASRPRRRRTSSRSPRRRRSASGPISTCSAPITRPRTAPACATTSRSTTSPAPISWPSTTCAAAARAAS